MKNVAVYTLLKPLYERVKILTIEHKRNSDHLDRIYYLGNNKVTDYIDNELHEDSVEYQLSVLKYEIEYLEKVMEAFYNKYKNDYRTSTLFDRMDEELFSVSRMEWEE